ncbi:MAG: efflux RND transporter periplasmic adaptor subunit [Gemmatimonadales bacterium]
MASLADDPPTPARRRGPRRRHLKWIVAAMVLTAAAIFGYRFWRDASLFASTDNAYIQANQAEITSQIAGQVTAVHVRDQQQVRQGDRLFDVDPRNFELAVERAKAEVAQRRAEAINAEGLHRRNQQLQASGFLSRQGAETSRAQMASAEAAVQVANAALKQAELDLERVHVASPANGTIANLTLRPGNMVQPGAPLFVVISGEEFWVDANFKETELEEIRTGQKAEIHSDVYPDRVFHGTVESVSGGSGAAFSVLPPQNATGNWVKVTQRVPVRIHIDDPDPEHPLRIGTTATVKVRKAT